MMLALLISCHANGIFSSRRIERATHRDIALRFVAASVHPDHDAIATFRRENLAALGESGIDALVSTAAEVRRRRHDFRPARPATARRRRKSPGIDPRFRGLAVGRCRRPCQK